MIFQHFGVLPPYTSIIIPTLKKAQFFFKESDFFSTLDEAGVTVTELTDEQRAEWIEAGQYFYQNDTANLGWSEGLYDTVKAAGKQ